ADADPEVRRASLNSLRLFGAPEVVPLALAALNDREQELTALECLGQLGGPEQAEAVAEFARRNPSTTAPAAAVRVLTAWRDRPGVTADQRQELDRAVAEMHGAHGILVRWEVNGPAAAKAASRLIADYTAAGQVADRTGWRTLFAIGTEARLQL